MSANASAAPQPKPLSLQGFPPLREVVKAAEKVRKPGTAWARIIADPKVKDPQKHLTENFNPAKANIHVKQLKQTGPAAMMIEATTEEDLEKLMQAEQLKELGYQVVKIQDKLPRVTIFGAQSSLASEDLIEEIHTNNEKLSKKYTKEQLKSKTRIINGWTNPNNPWTKNWILEVQPDVRMALMEQDSKLKMAWSIVKVTDLLDATRCFRCMDHGHIAKYCKQSQPTCGHCGENGHSFRNCPNDTADPVCAPCQRSGRPSNHSIKNPSCPARYKAMRNQIRSTNYFCHPETENRTN